MKYFAFFILLFSINSYGQTKPCDLTLKDSPTIRGLKLGMSFEQVKNLYPSASLFTDWASLDKNKIANSAFSKNLESIHIDFSKLNEVNEISFSYDDSVKWDSSAEFTDAISPSLNLSKGYWYCPRQLACHLPEVQRNLDCNSFGMSVIFLLDKPTLTIRKTFAELAIEEKQNQKALSETPENVKKKKAFKP